MKRVICIMLSLIIVIGMLPMSILATNAATEQISAVTLNGVTGSGTKDVPYIVSTGDQLEEITNAYTDSKELVYVRLSQDITAEQTLHIMSKMTIDMNGKNIKFNCSTQGFHIYRLSKLTLEGTGKINHSSDRNSTIYVEGFFVSENSVIKNSSDGDVITVASSGNAKIYDGEVIGDKIYIDNGDLYVYGGIIDAPIDAESVSYISISGGTFKDKIRNYGTLRVKDAEFLGEFSTADTGSNYIYSGYFKKGLLDTFTESNCYILGRGSVCIRHDKNEISVDDLFLETEITVYELDFAEEEPSIYDIPKEINQLDEFTISYKAKDLPEIFVKNGCTLEEKLVIRDSNNNVEYSEKKTGTTGQGISYNLHNLDSGEYKIERILSLYKNGSLINAASDYANVKVNPISEQDFGFKTMTPSVSDEDKADRYTELSDKPLETQTLTFGFTPQLSQELKNKGYNVKEKIYVNYNNQGTLVTLNSGANFNLMKYVDRLGDYQVWFNLSLYRGSEYVTSIGHIYNITIVPNAVRTLKANVTAPVDGALPNATVTPAGEGYKTTDVDWSYYDEADDEYYLMPDGMTFEAGKTYECAVQFDALPEYIFADNKADMTGYVNGYKGVISPVYSNKRAYVTVKFTVTEKDTLEVIFTPDSKAVAGGKLTVDIESMAEKDEELMEAYLNESVTYKWFYDGRLQVATKNNTYEIKSGMVGHYIAVKVVYGSKSVASEEFEITDATVTGLPGDVNYDGRVNVLDTTIVQKYVAGFVQLSENDLAIADVNKDGKVNVIDATQIQKFGIGLITKF